jgi:NAD(P)-dependent dehydrogenase (short-subunit alcohol dehydrogenase family)
MSTHVVQSAVLKHPISKVWGLLRPLSFIWNPSVSATAFQDNATDSAVGGVRSIHYTDGTAQKIQLTELSDAHYTLGWELIESTPAVSYSGVTHTVQLRRVTDSDTTFIEWDTRFSADIDMNVLADARLKQVDNFNGLAKELAKKFNFFSTADDVLRGVEMKGRTIVITGANSGIGLEAARALAQHGAHVIGLARDEKKGKELVDYVKQHAGKDVNIDSMVCDLNSLKSVRTFAKQYIEKKLPLHILINNAGIMATPQGTTEEGFESQIGVNHIGHFLLTTLLLPVLKSSAPSRVVALSSGAHHRSGIVWDNQHFANEKSYDKWKSYGQSKTANILFARHLNALMKKEGVQVTAVSVHPGVIATNLVRHMSEEETGSLAKMIWRRKNVGQGTSTTIVAAIEPQFGVHETSGVYLVDSNVVTPNKWADSDSEAAKLWDWTEKEIARVSK